MVVDGCHGVAGGAVGGAAVEAAGAAGVLAVAASTGPPEGSGTRGGAFV